MDYVDKALYIRSVNGICELMSKIHLSDSSQSEINRYEYGINQFVEALILILSKDKQTRKPVSPPFPIIIHKPANS